MKAGAPWSIKGIDADARETAKELAQKAGMTLGQWMNQTIAAATEPPASSAPSSAPANAAPVPTAEQAGSALDTARIMRAIAELARRVDGVAQNAGPGAGDAAQALPAIQELNQRIDALSRTVAESAPQIDQSRLERGMLAIARRVEAAENKAVDRNDFQKFREQTEAVLQRNAAATAPVDMAPMQAGLAGLERRIEALSAPEAAIAELNSRLDGIAERIEQPPATPPALDAMVERLANLESAVSDVRAAQGVAPSAADNGGLDALRADVRRMMNGMVNLAGKVDGVDSRMNDRVQAIDSRLEEVRTETGRRLDEGQNLVKSGIQALARQQNEAGGAGSGPDIGDALKAAIAPMIAQIAEMRTELDSLRSGEPATPEPSPEVPEVAASEPQTADPTPDPAPIEAEMPQATEKPADTELSGVASLHDMTRPEDIRVEAEPASVAFDADPPQPRRDEPSEEQPIGDDEMTPVMPPSPDTAPEPPRNDDAAREERRQRAAARATPVATGIPKEAAPPDRPQRLVPIESLLGGGAQEAPPVTPTDVQPEPASTGAGAAAAASADGSRRPFRLDEPLDLSRQTPAPPPRAHPGRRRRGLGYLLVALLFLALFVGGFLFAGTGQFRDLADRAGQVWQNVMATIGGAEFPSPDDEPAVEADESAPAPAAPPPEDDAARQATPEPTPAPQPVEPEPEAPQVAAVQPDPPRAVVEPPQPAAPASPLQQLVARAEQGNADAQYEVGVRYRDGDGFDPSYGQAADWFEQAALQGHVQAQLGLGIMYRQGLGRARDLDQAKLWLHAAARAGQADAQKLLGEVYADETSGAPDFFQAARWFRAAAEQGDVDAQFNMGVLYEGGLGVPRDFAQAYYWFLLAARSGDRSAPEEAARVGELLTPEQRTEIEAQTTGASASATGGGAAAAANADRVDTGAELDSRAEVRALQQLLIARGYDPGVPDGLPGARTRNAIRQWQADSGRQQDGRISSAVLNALRAGG